MSATVRPIGPLMEKNCSGRGAADTRPREGFSPKVPHHDDGLRIDPPPSEPCDTGQRPAMIADAAPPDEPPQLRSRFHGLRPGGYAGGSLTLSGPNSGTTVLPRIVKPARRMRATSSSSRSGMRSAHSAVPCVERMPAVSFKSLIEIGTPQKSGTSWPLVSAFSAARAASSACSPLTVMYAPRRGLMRSIRSRYSSASSTGDTSRFRNITA